MSSLHHVGAVEPATLLDRNLPKPVCRRLLFIFSFAAVFLTWNKALVSIILTLLCFLFATPSYENLLFENIYD